MALKYVPRNNSFSVGIVSPSLTNSAGGLLPVMQAHARGIQERGVTVAAYGIRQGAAEERDVGWAAIPCRLYPPTVRRLALSRALGSALAASRHDILHQHGIWLPPSSAVRAWSDTTGRPVVISTHGMLEPWALRNSGFKKRVVSLLCERRNLGSADCLHSFPVEVPAIRALGYQNPIAVIPNGIDLPDLAQDYPRPEFLERDDRRILLFLGRIHPKKGVRETLEAWALAIAERPSLRRDWILVIAGWDNGGYLVQEKQRAKELELEGAVAFPGAVFGVAKDALLHHASAFILASYSEGLPMAVLEAWAHETPVFMTRSCNIPEGFTANAAVEISVGPKEIAEILSERLQDPALAALGQRGRELVRTRFTWPRVTEELLAVYRWLLYGGKAPLSVDLSCGA